MHYWRQDSFEKLDGLKQRLGAFPELTAYINYTQLLGNGLRKDALKCIDDLLLTLCALPVERQRCIASLLFREGAYEPGHRLLPYPLEKQFLIPVIEEWKIAEPSNAEPFRWTGTLEDLIHAVELDPSCDETRRRLILRILGFIGFSTHELPAGYLGVVEDDYDLLRVAQREADRMQDSALREKYSALIADEKREIDEYRGQDSS